MGNVKKNLGMGKLIIAAIFLFNPNLVIIDFLPDFIGYIFLLLGISQLADLNYHFEESQNLFKRMFIVSLAHFFSIFLVFGFLPSREQSSAIMLVAFAFGALELILLIPGFKAFFDGFIYLGSRHESTSIFFVKQKKHPSEIKGKKKQKIKKANATTKAAAMTLIFVILKPVLTFAPEILALFDSSVDPNLKVNFYRYVDSFRFIALVFLLPLGIIWLTVFIRYVRSILMDKVFINQLTEKYTAEITPKTFIFIQRYIKLAFVVLAVALVFNVDFYIDNVSVLPDFVSPLIVLIVLGIFRKIAKAPLISYIFAVGYGVTSAVSFALNIYFYDNYTLTLTMISPEAHNAFMALTVFKVVDSLLFAGMIISLLPLLSKIIMENTGFNPIGTTNFNAEEKIRYIHNMLKKKLRIISVFTFVAALSSICYILFLRDFMYMWLIEFVVYISFTVYFVQTLNNIREEIDYKYMLS